MAQTEVEAADTDIFKKSPLSRAVLIDFSDERKLVLPPDFLEALKLEITSSHAILVTIREQNIIKFIPSESSSVVRVSIEISELSPYFLEDLGNLFARLNIKPLYSTGLVFTVQSCFYEAFFDSRDLPVPNECLKTELLNVRSVSGVRMAILS